MNTEIRFGRIAALILLAVVATGIIGYFLNQHLRLIGPVFFLLSFVVNFAVFYWITKKAQRGEITWLINRRIDE